MRFDISWSAFKSAHASKGKVKSQVQYACGGGHFDVAFCDGPFIFYVKLPKDGGADVAEFEADWKALANGAP